MISHRAAAFIYYVIKGKWTEDPLPHFNLGLFQLWRAIVHQRDKYQDPPRCPATLVISFCKTCLPACQPTYLPTYHLPTSIHPYNPSIPFLHQRWEITWYCWWFRNPKQPPPGIYLKKGRLKIDWMINYQPQLSNEQTLFVWFLFEGWKTIQL